MKSINVTDNSKRISNTVFRMFKRAFALEYYTFPRRHMSLGFPPSLNNSDRVIIKFIKFFSNTNSTPGPTFPQPINQTKNPPPRIHYTQLPRKSYYIKGQTHAHAHDAKLVKAHTHVEGAYILITASVIRPFLEISLM